MTLGRSLRPSEPRVPPVLTGGLTPTHLTASLVLKLRDWPAVMLDMGWTQELADRQPSLPGALLWQVGWERGVGWSGAGVKEQGGGPLGLPELRSWTFTALT